MSWFFLSRDIDCWDTLLKNGIRMRLLDGWYVLMPFLWFYVFRFCWHAVHVANVFVRTDFVLPSWTHPFHCMYAICKANTHTPVYPNELHLRLSVRSFTFFFPSISRWKNNDILVLLHERRTTQSWKFIDFEFNLCIRFIWLFKRQRH